MKETLLFSEQDLHELFLKIRSRQNYTPLYRKLPYSLATAPNTPVQVDLAGSYLHVFEATDTLANVEIRLNELTNDPITLTKGTILVTPFYRFYISWPAQAGKTATLIIGTEYELFRLIQSGQVISSIDTIVNPVIAKDYLLDRALNSQLYERAHTAAGVAGQKPHLQVKNPSGSGKTVVVTGWTGVTAGDVHYLYQYNPDLTTLIGTFYNLNIGGPAATAQLRFESTALSLGTNLLRSWRQNVSMEASYPFPLHIVLGEGEGCLVMSDTTNIFLAGGFTILEL